MKNEIYIGDNLVVMQSKQFEKYKNRIKAIYIDPPYNTKSNFSYKDTRNDDEWILFMKERLYLAKDMLSENGAIFISIDDNKYAELKILCDTIFNKPNFVGTFITHQAQRSNAKHINTTHEYILCYAKDKTKLKEFKIKRTEIAEQNKIINSISKVVKDEFDKNGIEKANKKLKELIKKYCYEYNITWLKNYSNVDNCGNIFYAKDLSVPGTPRKVDIESINLHLEPLETRGWSSDEKFISLHNTGMLHFKNNRPYEKHYLINSEDNAPSLLNFYSRQGTNDLNKLGLRDLFDTPKPVEMIKFLLRLVVEDGDVVLDFFGGSGTTAQAVYEINKESNNKINYILIQLDEKINENTKVYAACEKYGIEKTVSSILIHRISTFLSKNKIEDDYVVIKIQDLE